MRALPRFIFLFILPFLASSSWAQRSAKAQEVDSNSIKLNQLLDLLAGTRLTLLDCRNQDRTLCYSTIEFLNQSGFKGTIIGYSADNAKYQSVCEVVEVASDLEIIERQIVDLKISFKFCNKQVITFRSGRKLSASYTYAMSEIQERLVKEMRKLCPVNKPIFLESRLLKMPNRASSWKTDSLKNYLRSRPKGNIEGIYEQVVSDVNKQEANLKMAIARKGNGYEIVYLDGHPNFRDWVEGEYMGQLEPTGSRGMFKAQWINNEKEEKRNIFATYNDGTLQLILPAALEVNETNGRISGKNAGMFIKVVEGEDAASEGSATGFAVTSTGRIVTNYHVVEDAKAVYVRGLNGNFSERVKALVVATDKNNDLAILQVAGTYKVEPLPYRIMVKPIEVGAKVFVMGFPARDVMGSELKITDGVVSSRSGHEGDISCYQLSAPIQPGNSGSPVFDADGNLIGVANAGLRFLFDNVSYAIKSTYLNNFLVEADVTVTPPTQNSLKGQPMTEQLKTLRKYVYIIEVER